MSPAAIHEAGHVCIAKLFSVGVTRVTLNGTYFDSPRAAFGFRDVDPRCRRQRRLQNCGLCSRRWQRRAARPLVYRWRPHPLRCRACLGDRQEVARPWRLEPACAFANEVCQRHWTFITVLADKILGHGELSGEEVDRVWREYWRERTCAEQTRPTRGLRGRGRTPAQGQRFQH